MEMVDSMKPDDLLDYALGQLEGHQLAVFEAELSRDPDLLVQADRLSLSLRQLLDDGDAFNPPAGLADRTAAFVADRQGKRMILDFAPRRVPFRWADVAVAAGILAAGVLTLLPAIKSGREQMNQASCSFNLQRLGTSLASYAIRHRHYPRVCGAGAGTPVGWYAMALEGESLLPDSKALHCPCKGDCPTDSLRKNPQHMDFAYNVGYMDQKSGQAEPITPWLPSTVPLLADQPAHDGSGRVLNGNSLNHGGRGQNVLMSDLSHRWLPTRVVGPHDRDLFLNQWERPQPGVTVQDAAVIPAAFRIEPTR